jgi:hypothetical protein
MASPHVSQGSNDESRGLKIAVAALVTLSVILAVACYFLYSAYTAAEARRELAETRNRAAPAAPLEKPR